MAGASARRRMLLTRTPPTEGTRPVNLLWLLLIVILIVALVLVLR